MPLDGPASAAPALRDPELIADLLFMLGASAVLEREGPGGGTELVADVPAYAVDGLPAGTRVLGPADADQSWVAPPTTVRCGRRIVIRAAAAGSEQDGAGSVLGGDVVVRVTAGRAFGTGSHASTRLCMELLEDLAPNASTVLDVGCGTGVLGIAALLLGAGSVMAIDVDPVAVEATAVAARSNGVADRLVVDSAPLAEVPGTFDLVLANLLAPILEDLGADLAARVAPGGAIVVGGLLAEQVDRVVAALRPLDLVGSLRSVDSLQPVDPARPDQGDDGDWVSLVFKASV